jgi:hypothetical protein
MRITRVLAVLLGLFWVAAATLDILGVIPYSQAMPPLARRLAHSLPLGVSGLLLLLPYRSVRSSGARAVVGAGLCLSIGWMLSVSIGGVGGFMSGARSWQVLPVAVALPAVTMVNLWAFIRITSPRPVPVEGDSP